jgi:hypothetical protein
MILAAGKEGIVLLWFDSSTQKWDHDFVGAGLPEASGLRYWGSGSLNICRLGDDPVGYIATCDVSPILRRCSAQFFSLKFISEAFLGNVVAVYTKPQNSTKGAASLKQNLWSRHVVDGFGPLSSDGQTGTIQHVAAIHLSTGTGESFAIVCMEARPPEAIVMNRTYMVEHQRSTNARNSSFS